MNIKFTEKEIKNGIRIEDLLTKMAELGWTANALQYKKPTDKRAIEIQKAKNKLLEDKLKNKNYISNDETKMNEGEN